MEKFIDEKGVMHLKREPWMQDVMNVNYAMVPIKAITKGTLDGAWEQCIAEYLATCYKKHVNRDIIMELMAESGHPNSVAPAHFLEAAYLITQSKRPDHEHL